MSEEALINLGKQNPQRLRDIFTKAHRLMRLTAPGTEERTAALFRVAVIADAMYEAGL